MKGDKAALAECLELARADKRMAGLLRGRARDDAMTFAAGLVQSRALRLKPWQEPPCIVSADDPDERDKAAQRLLQRMLAAGVSRYAPDPLAALA